MCLFEISKNAFFVLKWFCIKFKQLQSNNAYYLPKSNKQYYAFECIFVTEKNNNNKYSA